MHDICYDLQCRIRDTLTLDALHVKTDSSRYFLDDKDKINGY